MKILTDGVLSSELDDELLTSIEEQVERIAGLNFDRKNDVTLGTLCPQGTVHIYLVPNTPKEGELLGQLHRSLYNELRIIVLSSGDYEKFRMCVVARSFRQQM